MRGRSHATDANSPADAGWALLALAFATAASCQTGTARGSSVQRRGRMSDLIAQVRAHDPSATLLAAEMGPSAAESLIPLTRDSNEEVREIALLCLAETGGSGAVRAALARLNDPAPMVRGAALRGLERLVRPADVPALLHALEATDDAGARRYVALLIGRIGAPRDIPALQAACGKRADTDTQEGCVAALAQLGDPPMREEFLRRLTTSRDRALARMLEYAEAIRAAWLLPALGQLLDDRTEIRWIGVDGLPGPKSLRVADIALNLIAEISGHRFSFPVAPNVNYTDAQLAEARSVAGR